MRLSHEETKKLIKFWEKVVVTRIEMANEYRWIQGGYPSNSPYDDQAGQLSDYLNFRVSTEISDGEPIDRFDSIEDAAEALCKNLVPYIAQHKRVLIRQWPKISCVDNLTREKPYYTIKCRLLCDDGIRKLKEHTIKETI